jgi:uncharacterized protein (DUF1330 family)
VPAYLVVDLTVKDAETYAEAKALRQRSASADMVLIEGAASPTG